MKSLPGMCAILLAALTAACTSAPGSMQAEFGCSLGN